MGTATTVEHRIVGSELVGPATGQRLYTCACGFEGRAWLWDDHAEQVGGEKLPPFPSKPPVPREALHKAIYGHRHRCQKCSPR